MPMTLLIQKKMMMTMMKFYFYYYFLRSVNDRADQQIYSTTYCTISDSLQTMKKGKLTVDHR
jgi:hypothetical protein